MQPDLLNKATPPEAEAHLDPLWATEAEDRLAAYQRGEITSIPLAEVLAKYPSIRPLKF